MPNVRVAIVNPETKQPCAITDFGEVKFNGDCICMTGLLPLVKALWLRKMNSVNDKDLLSEFGEFAYY